MEVEGTTTSVRMLGGRILLDLTRGSQRRKLTLSTQINLIQYLILFPNFSMIFPVLCYDLLPQPCAWALDYMEGWKDRRYLTAGWLAVREQERSGYSYLQ